MMVGNFWDNGLLSSTDQNIFARLILASAKFFWKWMLRRK